MTKKNKKASKTHHFKKGLNFSENVYKKNLNLYKSLNFFLKSSKKLKCFVAIAALQQWPVHPCLMVLFKDELLESSGDLQI
jgi:hypothetical protein